MHNDRKKKKKKKKKKKNTKKTTDNPLNTDAWYKDKTLYNDS